ncbi:MAG: 50S ribosomal protein L9 [Planctomycetia bacterium]|nr:50S ribosomal protein L9 [Planctomycetia bacterium]
MPNTRKQKKIKRNSFKMKRLPKGPNGGVELLLIQSVDSLGKQGDVVEVRPGYAHNYLIPQGLATIATDHHKRMVEKHKARLAEIYKAKHAEMEKLAEELRKASVSIQANANDSGHLYGSIGAPEIVAALKEINLLLTEDQIRLVGPLRELGLYTVRVHLSAEIESEVHVWVVPTVVAQ